MNTHAELRATPSSQYNPTLYQAMRFLFLRLAPQSTPFSFSLGLCKFAELLSSQFNGRFSDSKQKILILREYLRPSKNRLES